MKPTPYNIYKSTIFLQNLAPEHFPRYSELVLAGGYKDNFLKYIKESSKEKPTLLKVFLEDKAIFGEIISYQIDNDKVTIQIDYSKNNNYNF